jgi:SAM-dependent methyltransferase
VREAHTLARTLGHHNTAFCQADAEALPFCHDVCDLITNKLAFHYFPHPQVAVAEMARVATRAARLVLIDRVSPEDPEKRAYQNRLEKLRIPSKTYVYSESQLAAALADIGLIVEAQARYAEQMEEDAWLRAAGPDEQTAHPILAMLTADGDPAGLQVRREGDQLLMTHQTVVLVACRQYRSWEIAIVWEGEGWRIGVIAIKERGRSPPHRGYRWLEVAPGYEILRIIGQVRGTRDARLDHPVAALQERNLPCQPHRLARPSSMAGSSSPRPFSSPW